MARLVTPDALDPADRGFGVPAHIDTMITPLEMAYLRALTRDLWDGRRDVVEFGPWLGGSTWCLASGMAENPRRTQTTELIAVDDFIWREFFGARTAHDLRPGESFEPLFRDNLAAMPMVRSLRRRLPDEPGPGPRFAAAASASDARVPLFRGGDLERPVGLVFVDAAKSWPGVVHLLAELAPHSPPGTLWTWQDFKLAAAYWVHLAVGWLLRRDATALELVDVVEFNSITLRTTAAFGPQLVADLPRDLAEVEAPVGLDLLGRSASLLEQAGDPHGATLVRLGAAAFLADKGDREAAAGHYRAVERRWPRGLDRRQLLDVRAHLAQSLGRTPAPTARGLELLARQQVARVRNRLRRAISRPA